MQNRLSGLLLLGLLVAGTAAAESSPPVQPLGILQLGGSVALRDAAGVTQSAPRGGTLHIGDTISNATGTARVSLADGREMALRSSSSAVLTSASEVSLIEGGLALSARDLARVLVAVDDLRISGVSAGKQGIVIVERVTASQITVTSVEGTFRVRTAGSEDNVALVATGDALQLHRVNGVWQPRAAAIGSPLLLPAAQSGVEGGGGDLTGQGDSLTGEDDRNDRKAWWFWPAVGLGTAAVVTGTVVVVDDINDDDDNDDDGDEQSFTGGGGNPTSPIEPPFDEEEQFPE
jgi:hypothetical protein